jgi:hypothetical protein
MNRLFIIVLFSLLYSNFCFGQEIKLDASVDKALVSTNETLIYTVKLEVPKGKPVSLPELGDSVQGFRVIDFGKKEDLSDNEVDIFSRWYKLQADISGSYILPSIKIVYQDNGKEEKTLQTSEIFIEVQAVGTDKTSTALGNDIKDIKEIELSPVSYQKIIIMISILLIVIGVLVYLRLRKQKVIVPEVTISPYEKAIQGLSILRQIELTTEEDQKKYYFKISEIIRLYVEEEFDFPASDRTNEEIRKNVSKIKVFTQSNRNTFLEILTKADLVKFANIQPSIEDGQSILLATENFIEEIYPRPESTESKEEESFL